ncbi:MAG: hypothetical protein QXW13_00315 [Nanopusillaceae archaeon]
MKDIDCGTRIIVRCNDEMEQSNRKISTLDNLKRSREISKSTDNVTFWRDTDKQDIDISKILSKTNKKEKII